MANFDGLSPDIKKKIMEIQQNYYELLPDWSEYKSGEHKYLKANIGYAFHGPPSHIPNCYDSDTSNAAVHVVSNMIKDCDVIDVLSYDKNTSESIEVMYEKICEYGIHPKEKSIYIGIIYNVICLKPQKEDSLHEISIKAIVKLRNYSSATYYNVWYIDDNCRIYTDWSDYITSNKLPECIMFTPRKGIYQHNPRFPVTVQASTVWIERNDSPSSKIGTKFLSNIDAAATVLTFGSAIGLTAAAFITPIGPLLTAAGIAAQVAGGSWTFGRSSQQLIDRNLHKQSIALDNSEAAAAWMGACGSAFGVAASGGTALLSKAVEKGVKIGTAIKVTYNTVIVGNLIINGSGIACEGYHIYNKYNETKKVELRDLFVFGTHMLFFGNAVMNIQFANKIIETQQTSILKDYESKLRSKRLRKAYNSVKRKATNSHTRAEDANAEIIRTVNKTKRFTCLVEPSPVQVDNSIKISVTAEAGKITVNGVPLIDARKFVVYLIEESDLEKELNNYGNNNQRNVLAQWLKDFLLENNVNSGNVIRINDIDSLLKDVRQFDDLKDLFRKIFNIALGLIKQSVSPESLIVLSLYFVWRYVKENLKKWSTDFISCRINSKIMCIVRTFINGIHAFCEMIVQELLTAFSIYLSNKKVLTIFTNMYNGVKLAIS